MADASRENRIRIVRIGARDILHFFTIGMASKLPDVVTLPVWPGVPADCEVVAVNYAPLFRTFDFIVAHPSFDVVPVGFLPIVFPGDNEVVEMGTRTVLVNSAPAAYHGGDVIHPTVEGVAQFVDMLGQDDVATPHVVEKKQ